MNTSRERLRLRARRVGRCAGALLALLACGPPDFVLHVTYPGRVDLEEGARVLYQGIAVGHVESISLRQASPEEPALVQVTLSISNTEVTLREADRIHVSSTGVLGDRIVQISPATEPSKPLESSAVVAGVPPLVTRVEQSLGSTLDALGEMASEKVEELLEEFAESLRESDSSGPAPVPRTPPEPEAPGPSSF